MNTAEKKKKKIERFSARGKKTLEKKKKKKS